MDVSNLRHPVVSFRVGTVLGGMDDFFTVVDDVLEKVLLIDVRQTKRDFIPPVGIHGDSHRVR